MKKCAMVVLALLILAACDQPMHTYTLQVTGTAVKANIAYLALSWEWKGGVATLPWEISGELPHGPLSLQAVIVPDPKDPPGVTVVTVTILVDGTVWETDTEPQGQTAMVGGVL